MAAKVEFKAGTSQQYAAATKSENTLYFLTDTRQLMKGEEDFTSSVLFVDKLPGVGIEGKEYIVGRRGYTYKVMDGAYQWFLIYDIEEIESNIQEVKDEINGIKESVESVKSDVETAKTDIESIKTDVTSVKSDVDTAKSDINNLKSDVEFQGEDIEKLDNYTDHLVYESVEAAETSLNSGEVKEVFYGRRLSIKTEGVYLSYIVQPGKDGKDYSVLLIDTDTQMIWSDIDDDIDYHEATTEADIADAFNTGDKDINVEIKSDIVLDPTTSFKVFKDAKAIVKLDEGVTLTTDSVCFDVENGGSLTLSGQGTILNTSKKSSGVVNVSGPSASVIIDGITIDCISKNGAEGNYAYGIYAAKGASVNVYSGVIKVGQGCAISTNNTTGGGIINISGGKLLSDGDYGIYLPSQGTINITGGEVQGINARMGHISISGKAKIIPTAINSSNYDDIGDNIKTSGCIWLGDTIAVVAGTYTDSNGEETIVNISGDAIVESNFRSAVSVYAVDTKKASNVTINIENSKNITTTDSSSDAIKVYDHTYIADAANAKGKAYSPIVDSEISIKSDGTWIYPEN